MPGNLRKCKSNSILQKARTQVKCNANCVSYFNVDQTMGTREECIPVTNVLLLLLRLKKGLCSMCVCACACVVVRKL